jgi:hypothetical protein
MTAENIKVLTGLCKWANVPPRPAQKIKAEDVQSPDHANDSSYSIMIECDAATFRELKAKKIPPGTILHDDIDKDGVLLSDKTYLRVRSSKVKGEYTFPDPIVKNADGTNVTQNIGNGSKVQVAIEIAPNKAKGGSVLRLKGVKVLELVEWIDTNSGSADTMDALGLVEPAPTSTAAAEDIFK